MKTMTITLHDTDNCGSSLQAFALQQFLLENNIENQIINYVPKYIQNNGRPFNTAIRKVIFYKDSLRRTKKFQNFISKYLRLTSEKYKNYTSLQDSPPLADVYLTGSDQLWNSNWACGRDSAFYLGFICNKRKLAYAVSLGKDNVSNHEINWIVSNASDFNWISVREKSSKDLLEANGITNVDHVCDPVLLLSKETYEKMQSPVIRKRKYALIYLVVKSDLLENVIKYIKTNLQYDIVFCGSYRSKCTCEIHLRDLAPGEFLDLIANAELVVSSSFHATVFSHIYHKQFLVILPSKNQARLEDFLEISNLQRCIIRHNGDVAKAIQPIDYNLVNESLYPFVEKSKKLLLSHLMNNL